MNMQVYNLGEVSQATYKKGPRALWFGVKYYVHSMVSTITRVSAHACIYVCITYVYASHLNNAISYPCVM